MFFEPQPTPFDLRWTMFGIPIRVHPLFWLFTALLGFNVLDRGFEYLLMWVVCVFVSILIHELGHVLMGRIFGSRGSIVLYSFGGLAIGSSNLVNRWQRIAVYVAGPGAQFIIFLVVAPVYLSSGVGKEYGLLKATLWYLFEINLFWPILNLLPIFPLDGGQVCKELMEWFVPVGGFRIVLIISIALCCLIAAIVAISALAVGDKPDYFLILLFASLGFYSFQLMQQLRPPDQDRWQ